MSRKSPIWPKVAADFVQKNLNGHKILGLAVAGLLYLICLSGTVTVFYLDMQRWETATAPEAVFTPQGVAKAVEDARRLQPKDATSLSAYLPTPDSRRLLINAGKDHIAYDSAGRRTGKADMPVVEGLSALHYELNLPGVAGVVIVGLGGVAIIALLIGGLLAHPRIFKDAFLWRLRSGARLNRSDLHNRLGVWAAPFHLIIAVTGALIGLSQIIVLVAGLSFYKGDLIAAAAPLYGDMSAKTVAGRMDEAAIVNAFGNLKHAFPDARPNYLILNNLNTDHESLTVWADLPDRLIYAEQFEFDGKGRRVARHHLNDGPVGKQVWSSLYKLHFGSFGGTWVLWVYALLGLGLTAICATGMDIWLLKSAQKGQLHPRLHRLWVGYVWAAPTAMCVAAVTNLTGGGGFAPIFWTALVLLSVAAVGLPNARLVSRLGRWLLAVLLLALVGVHFTTFESASVTGSALWVNLSLLAIGLICTISTLHEPSQKIGLVAPHAGH